MIEIVNIKDIKPNLDNPRVIKDNKFKKLVKSIMEFPEMLQLRPIVVNDDMVVLGGNMRLRACNEAGLDSVYIIKASNLTEEKQREFIIKDNVGFGEWDWDDLANEWNENQLREWGLDLPVFDVEQETIDEAEESNGVKLSIEVTNNAFLEMHEKLENLCTEYNAILKVK